MSTPHFKLVINGRAMNALLDTGSDSNHIADICLDEDERQYIDNNDVYSMSTAGGQAQSCGSIILTVFLEDSLSYNIKFNVLNTITDVDVIIGCQFLRTMNAVIDFKQDEVVLCGKTYKTMTSKVCDILKTTNVDALHTSKIFHQIINNIRKNPYESKYRKINATSRIINDAIIVALCNIGFRRENDYLLYEYDADDLVV